jgi:hypothetical protein
MPTATQRDLNAYIGKVGHLDFDGLTVQVKVTDARVRFGHVDLLLTPTAGTGTRWIQADRVKLRATRSTTTRSTATRPTAARSATTRSTAKRKRR